MLVHRKGHKEVEVEAGVEERKDPDRGRVRVVDRVVDRVVGRVVEDKVDQVSAAADYSRCPYKLEHRLEGKGPGTVVAGVEV